MHVPIRENLASDTCVFQRFRPGGGEGEADTQAKELFNAAVKAGLDAELI
jgi:hypothetical protein